MLLDDINKSRTDLQERSNNLANDIIVAGGGRYNTDTADQADNWDGRWLQADRERLKQLDLLSHAVQDPSWTANLNREADTRRDANNASLDEEYRQYGGRTRSDVAAAGRGGSSWEAVTAAKSAQRLAAAKAQVSQQVNELKAAGVANLEDMGRQLLDHILSGSDDAQAMETSLQGARDQQQGDVMLAQNNADYRNLLANTIAGFVGNTLTPAVVGGFQSAGNYNNALRQDYTDARETGTFNGPFANYANANGGTRSWWGF